MVLVVIRYCQTDNMHADFFTKALQDSPFRQHRDFVMNLDPAYYTGVCCSQPANTKPGGQGLDNAKPRTSLRDDLVDPSPYRTALLDSTEGEHVGNSE
jgi:hypothetical protein